MRSLPSTMVSSAAVLSILDTSPSRPALLATRKLNDGFLSELGRPPQRQRVLEGAEESAEILTLRPQWYFEGREAAADLGIALKRHGRVTGAHGHDADSQLVCQVLQEVQRRALLAMAVRQQVMDLVDDHHPWRMPMQQSKPKDFQIRPLARVGCLVTEAFDDLGVKPAVVGLGRHLRRAPPSGPSTSKSASAFWKVKPTQSQGNLVGDNMQDEERQLEGKATATSRRLRI